jgi:hypothetical protein
MNFSPPKSLMKGNILTITDDVVELVNRAHFEYMTATYGHIRPLWTPADMDDVENVSKELEFMIHFIIQEYVHNSNTDYPLWKRVLLSNTFITDDWETGGACVDDKKPFGNSGWERDILRTLKSHGVEPEHKPEDYTKELYEDMRAIVQNFRPRYRRYRVEDHSVGIFSVSPKDGEVIYEHYLLVPEKNFCDRVKNIFK